MQPILLVTITLPGVVWRLATEPVDVESDDGLLRYEAGVVDAPDIEEELDPYSGEGRAPLTQARLVLDLGSLPGAVLGEWLPFAAAVGEVALLQAGQRWEARQVLLAGGTLQGITVGVDGEATTLTVEAASPTTAAIVGDPTRLVGEVYPVTTGYTALDGVEFPIILGRCYRRKVYKVGTIAAGVVGGVVAGHRLPAGFTLYHDGVSHLTSATWGAQTDAVIEGTTSDFPYSTGAAVTIDLPHGGAPCWRDASRATTSAADVLEWLLGASGARVDWRRTERALARLASWEIAVYLDESAEALEVIRQRLLPLLPLVEGVSGEGVYYTYADPLEEDVVGAVVAGQNGAGLGGWACSDLDRVQNAWSLRYFHDDRVGEFLMRLTLDGDTDPYCALSEQLYGRRAVRALDAPGVWSEVTARRILTGLAARYALPRWSRTYYTDLTLQPGQVVLLTDEESGITGRRALVRRVSPFDPGAVLELVEPFAFTAAT